MEAIARGSVVPSESGVESQVSVAGVRLPLEQIYFNERSYPTRLLFTQPAPDGSHSLLEWNWAQAVGESRRVAAYLRSQGWRPGSRIAILAKNCAWWIMADFAIWMAGHVSVPIFPGLSASAVGSLLEHCQPAACFVGACSHPPVQSGIPLIWLPTAGENFRSSPGSVSWSNIIADWDPVAESPSRAARDVATLIYTSGTMGEPKGVMQTFESLAMMAESMKPVIAGGGDTDRILSYLPLAHIAERSIVEANCLYRPMHIFFTAGPATFLGDLKRARPTLFFTVPRLLAHFQRGVREKIPQKTLSLLLSIPLVRTLFGKHVLAELGLDRVRVAASGSAPLPVETLHWYRRLGLNLIEGYGMTETGITHASLAGRLRPGYVGDASPCATTRISPEGEVQIKGPMNLVGYYHNPELTRESFTVDGYFKTGDRGEIDKEGRLRIIGRLKEEFKTSKGKYVIPAPIERELSLNGFFDSVCVLGEGLEGPFVAAVLAESRRPADAGKRAELEPMLSREIDRVNQKLERHERLRFLVIVATPWTVENGLLTPALKVRRIRLEQKFRPSFHAWEASQKRVLWLED